MGLADNCLVCLLQTLSRHHLSRFLQDSCFDVDHERSVRAEKERQKRAAMGDETHGGYHEAQSHGQASKIFSLQTLPLLRVADIAALRPFFFTEP